MFADLLASPGVREEVELRSRFGFMAFHGGSLEEGTDVVAREAAARAGASLYAVVQPPELRWHVPSRLVRADASARLAAFLDHVDVVVAVHGYGRAGRWTTLLLGGPNRELAAHLAGPLRAALADYEVVDELDDVPVELRGLHAGNPVSCCRDGGVQLELPPRARGLGPYWEEWRRTGDGLAPHTEALVEALAEAARTWPPLEGPPVQDAERPELADLRRGDAPTRPGGGLAG